MIENHKAMLAPSRRATRARAAAMLTCLATVSATAFAQTGKATTGDRAALQAAGQSFRAQAAQLGVTSCAGLFADLGAVLTQGSTYTSTASAHRTAPNEHVAQAVTGMTYDTPGYKGQAAGVVVTAPTKSGCEGSLVRVAPFPQSCPDVVRLLPQGSTLATTLSGTPVYTLGGNQGDALLVASGAGCVVVTVANAAVR